MNKEFHLIINKLSNEDKIKKIAIYTNGTIIPAEDKMECLKNKKVILFITDYGVLSGKLEELKEYLGRNNIAYYAEKAKGWTDCAGIKKHSRTKDDQRALFRNCCAKNTTTLLDGKLYRCPFSANADKLHAIPVFQGDYVDILQYSRSKGDAGSVKNALRTLLFEKDYLETCDYCNGRSFDDAEITPAVQVKDPLEYESSNRNF